MIIVKRSRLKRRDILRWTCHQGSTAAPKMPLSTHYRLKKLWLPPEKELWTCSWHMVRVFINFNFPKRKGTSSSSILFNAWFYFILFSLAYAPGWYIAKPVGQRLLRKYSDQLSTWRLRGTLQACILYSPSLLCGIGTATVLGNIWIFLANYMLYGGSLKICCAAALTFLVAFIS